MGALGAAGAGTTGRMIRASKYTPIRLADDQEKEEPFRSDMGKDMMATRQVEKESRQVRHGGC